MRRNVVDPRFRAVLANLIISAGIRQAELARRANLSPSHLSQIINGDRNPSDQVARVLDEVLGGQGQLADLVIVAANPEDLDQVAAVAANPRKVSFATLDSFRRMLASQRHLDDVMGSAALVGPTMAHLHLVTSVANEAVGPARAPVLYEAAQWLQFAGWLHISIGKRREAGRHLDDACLMAEEIDDADLKATILSYQAHIAWLSLQSGRTVGLALAAMRNPRVYPGQRAYDAYQAARASASMGDLLEAQRLLDVGEELAVATAAWDGAVPAWQYYRAPWFWALERGLVRLYMARWQPDHAGAAVAALRDGIDGIPEEMAGADWAGEYLVHLASAYRRAGELDEARSTLGRSRFIAEATHSSRVLQLVATGERALRIEERGL